MGALHGPGSSFVDVVASIAAPLAAGNAVVVVLPADDPLPGLDFGEVLGVSDIPAGVVNLVSGRTAELVGALASHRDVNALWDLTGDADLSRDIDTFASETLKRVLRGTAQPPLDTLAALTEIRTVWHPVGA